MTIGKFEGHITVEVGHTHTIEKLCLEHGYKYSRIDGDPVMGKRLLQYATRYDDTAILLLSHMRTFAQFLKQEGFKVVRVKVEKIVYDKRYA